MLPHPLLRDLPRGGNYRLVEKMMSQAVIEIPQGELHTARSIEHKILEQIQEQSVIGMDALVAYFQEYGWSQIFQAIDRLARQGKIVLRRHRFEYTIFSPHYAT